MDRTRLTEALMKLGVPARFEDDPAVIVKQVLSRSRTGDVVLVLSNGAFGGIHDMIRRELCGRFGD